MSDGGRANATGRVAEDVIDGILRSKGIRASRQYPIGAGIFGTELRADFYMYPTARFPKGLFIESKWQEVSGSAEEKLPYLVENIRRCYPAPVIVVVAGGGHREGAINWLRHQADGYKLMHVFRLEEFLVWLNRSL